MSNKSSFPLAIIASGIARLFGAPARQARPEMVVVPLAELEQTVADMPEDLMTPPSGIRQPDCAHKWKVVAAYFTDLGMTVSDDCDKQEYAIFAHCLESVGDAILRSQTLDKESISSQDSVLLPASTWRVLQTHMPYAIAARDQAKAGLPRAYIDPRPDFTDRGPNIVSFAKAADGRRGSFGASPSQIRRYRLLDGFATGLVHMSARAGAIAPAPVEAAPRARPF